MTRRRYAIVGTGARADMFVRALTQDHAATTELVALCDSNPLRIAAYDRWLTEAGHPPVPGYPADRLAAMLAEQRVDVLVVSSMDSAHAEHIVTGLEAGCDVLTEKPMTTTAEGAQAVLDAQQRTGRHVGVTFNYRFNPVHEKVRTLLAEGAVGEIGSVHFEWLLDVRHGADYFRRWHRDRASSGGLLVHKSGHHFDLVNWWLGARPAEVFAAGRLFFYGENGRRHGYDRGYERAHDAPEADGDPFALRLAGSDRLKALYLDAEQADGYQRDRNVFAPGVTVEDDMAVLVRYDTGATMTYHLTAYAPWEGYRLMVNGSKGRLELEVVESDHVSPAEASGLKGAAVHGVDEAAEQGWARLTLHPYWEPPREIELPERKREGHGGGDARMLGVLLGAATDPLDRSATARDGALALLTGLAANRSIETGVPVRVADLLNIPTETE